MSLSVYQATPHCNQSRAKPPAATWGLPGRQRRPRPPEIARPRPIPLCTTVSICFFKFRITATAPPTHHSTLPRQQTRPHQSRRHPHVPQLHRCSVVVRHSLSPRVTPTTPPRCASLSCPHETRSTAPLYLSIQRFFAAHATRADASPVRSPLCGLRSIHGLDPRPCLHPHTPGRVPTLSAAASRRPIIIMVMTD